MTSEKKKHFRLFLRFHTNICQHFLRQLIDSYVKTMCKPQVNGRKVASFLLFRFFEFEIISCFSLVSVPSSSRRRHQQRQRTRTKNWSRHFIGWINSSPTDQSSPKSRELWQSRLANFSMICSHPYHTPTNNNQHKKNERKKLQKKENRNDPSTTPTPKSTPMSLQTDSKIESFFCVSEIKKA